MKENLLLAMTALLKHEGGFVNHPADPGGMTNLGVTQKVWEEWVGHSVSEQEMRALTPAIVAPMYKQKYWDKIHGDDLPSGVDLAVFDCCVNSGPGRAAKMLQKVLGVTQDGAIGAQTLLKTTTVDSSKLVADYNAERLAFLQALPTWDTFGKGWGRRVAEVTDQATRLSTLA
jgi:lysozyme family protein